MPRQGPRRRRLRPILAIGATLGFVILAAGAFIIVRLRASLPLLDGRSTLAGLSAPVEITRDAAGRPTLVASSRTDALRALGWLHGHERRFQMDLQRRSAAGELSGLFGEATVAYDRQRRRHQMREVAERAWAVLPARQRADLEAYAAGVNAGVAALGGRPFEYQLLRLDPDPWTPVDSLLSGMAMYFSLQVPGTRPDALRAAWDDALGTRVTEWLWADPAATRWSSPNTGPTRPPLLPPPPEVLDLRSPAPTASAPTRRGIAGADPAETLHAGSNAFAVAGRRTADGRAILANDPHLSLGLPNTWYPAHGRWTAEDGSTHSISGATLPGLPVWAIGSNGHVAWGMTHAAVDSVDAVVVETVPGDPDHYLSPDGPLPFVDHAEQISVRGRPSVTEVVRTTIWGPLEGTDAQGRPLALRWVAHLPVALDLTLGDLPGARTLEEAVDTGARAAGPALGMIVASADGRIGWVLAGALPLREGFDGRTAGTWSDGSRRWTGLVPPAGHPRIIDPPSGFIWTANALADARPSAREIPEDADMDPGLRSSRIRDRLAALSDRSDLSPEHLLAIALDAQSAALLPWRDVLLNHLQASATTPGSERAALAAGLRSWDGTMAVDSVPARVVRSFRQQVAIRALTPFSSRVASAGKGFEPFARSWSNGVPQNVHEALLQLAELKPPHLLDPRFADWDALFAEALKDVLRQAREAGGLSRFTWGAVSSPRILHPLSLAVPLLAPFLDAPDQPLPGESDSPRANARAFGASLRIAVSPGAEDQGLFHMPGGVSGHPWARHYLAGHADWVAGSATPLRPDSSSHRLVLQPQEPR